MKILQTEQVSRPFGYIFFEIRKGEREGGGGERPARASLLYPPLIYKVSTVWLLVSRRSTTLVKLNCLLHLKM